MKSPTTYATRSQLLDYVTKNEFKEFKDETYDRFDIIDIRFDSIDKRLNNIDRRLSAIDKRFAEMNETIRISIGAPREQFREDLKTSLEFLKR